MRAVGEVARLAASRWLAVELAAGIAALCVTIVGVAVIVSILATGGLAAILPVTFGFGSASIWLAGQAWPIVLEAWNGFPPLA